MEGSASLNFIRLNHSNLSDTSSEILESEALQMTCKKILLYTLDKHWSEHLENIAGIRQGIHLRSMGGQTPYFEFQKIATHIFQQMKTDIEAEALETYTQIIEKSQTKEFELQELKRPSATWTYLINDDPDNYLRSMFSVGNISNSLGIAILSPIIAISLLANRVFKKVFR